MIKNRALPMSVALLLSGCGDADSRSDDMSSGSTAGTTEATVPTTTASPDSDGEGVEATLPGTPSLLVVVKDVDGVAIAGAVVIPRIACEVVMPTPLTADPHLLRSGRAPRAAACPVATITNSVGIAAFQPIQTAEDGVFRFEVRHDHHSSAIGEVRFTEERKAITYEVRLHPTIPADFSAEAGLPELAHDGISVRVEPNSLVYETGARDEALPDASGTFSRDLRGVPVTGMVHAELAVVHPSTVDSRAFPGPMYGTGADGVTSPLFSGGMLEFRMTSEGFPVQPRPGTSVQVTVRAKDLSDEIRAEMEAQAQSEGKIPKWSLSPDTALWSEDGFWNVEHDEQGELVFTTAQSHFTWINVDVPGILHCQNLQVVDGEGNGIAGLPVSVVNGWHSGGTGAGGWICAESPYDVTLAVCGQEVVMKAAESPAVSACLDSKNVLGKTPKSGECNTTTVDCLLDPICVPHSYRICGHSDGTEGICEDAKQHCLDGWKWSDCPKPINKEQEVCTPPKDLDAALDEDCDGQVDEDCGCDDPGPTQFCYPGPPSELESKYCMSGLQQCVQGAWGECVAKGPDPEDCTTPDVDENCDGITECLGGAMWAVQESAANFDIQGDAIAVVPNQLEDVVVGLNVTRKGPGEILMVCNNNLDPILVHEEEGESDALVAWYMGDKGLRAWVRRLGGPGEQRIHDVAVIKENNVVQVVVLGDFTGIMEPDECGSPMCLIPLDADPQNNKSAARHLFVAKFDEQGTCLARTKVTFPDDKKAGGEAYDPRFVIQSNYDALIVATVKGVVELQDKLGGFYDVPNNGKLTSSGLLVSSPIGFGVNPIGRVEGNAVAVISSAMDTGEQVPRAIALSPNKIAVVGSYTGAFASEGLADAQELFIREYDPDIMDPMPADYLLPLTPGDQIATSVAYGLNDELIVGGTFDKGGVNSMGLGCLADASGGGFVAYDVKKIGKVTGAKTCINLQSARQDAVHHLVAVPGSTDVVVAATALGDKGKTDVMTPGLPGLDPESKDCALTYAGKAQDGIVFRLHQWVDSVSCEWATLFPESLAVDINNSPSATDNQTHQSAWRVAAGSKGTTFVTGRFVTQIGFLAPNSEAFNLQGSSDASAYVAKLSP